MEILGYLSGFMLAIMLVVVAAQLVFGYAMQCLAKKNEMSSLAETLAWLPILNIYPFIVCGGGSFPRFLMGVAGFIVASIGLGVVSGMAGEGAVSMVVGIAGIAAGLGALFYFGRIFWRTAERRGLHGFIGLLNFVPGVNLLAYPYIAFHDGFVPVNKVGAALGFILIAGPSIAQYQMINMATTAMQAQVTEAGQEIAGIDLNALVKQAAQQNLAGTAEPPDALTPGESQIERSLFELEALNPSDPANAIQLTKQLAEAKQQFAGIEQSLPADRAASLRLKLVEAQLRLADVPQPEEPEATEPELVAAGTPSTPAPFSLEAAPSAPPAAQATDAATTARAVLPFRVPEDMSCEAGTVQEGSPNGETWCQRSGGGLKHGWWSDRHPSSQLAQAGQYRDGLRHGVWTRWYEDGQLRVQAEFDRGLQNGYLVAWDRTGNETARVLFEEGNALAP